MKKFFLRFSLILLSVFTFLVLVSIIATSLFGNKIGNKIVEAINEQLISKVEVERFDLSLIKSFPNFSANLRNVSITGSDQKPLLEAKLLSFKIGLFSLLNSKVSLKSAMLKDGAVFLKIGKSGDVNYNILKPSTETTDEKNNEGQEIAIERTSLQNMEISYEDLKSDQKLSLWIQDSNFSGDFSKESFSLTSDATLLIKNYVSDGEMYLVGKDASYTADINVNLEKQVYNIQKVSSMLGGNNFDVKGSIEPQKQGTYFDLEIHNNKGDLASLLQLFPEEYLGFFKDAKSKGDFNFEVFVKGLSTSDQQPAIKGVLALNRGRISFPELDKDFDDVSLAATFNNGRRQNMETFQFNLENLTGYFGRDKLSLSLLVDNFEDPKIDFSLDGILPMAAFYGISGNPKIKRGSGEIIMDHIYINGRIKDLQTPSRLAYVKSSGKLVFKEASINYNDEDLTLVSGEVSLKDNALTINELIFKGAGSELRFQGSAFNFMPVLFADSVNSKRAELEFVADLQARSIDLDRLMALSEIDEKTTTNNQITIDSLKEARIQKREKVTNFLKGSFNAAIDEFNYNEIKAKEFSGKIEFINNEMNIIGSTKAMEGDFQLDGQVFFEDEPRLKAKLICNNVKASEFFKETQNFGQEVLTYKNIEGELNAKISISAFWDNEGTFQKDKLRVLAGIGIENGELINFEMLKQFSTFVKIEDLMHIKFLSLQNFLEYRKNKLTIPVMFIQSNAMNLTINGEHSYDNEIKYNLKVNAGQILANKFKRYDPSLKPLKARKNGFFNLYYSIFGNIEKYQIKAAKRQIKSDFELSSHRRRELQLALEQEFGAIALVEEPIEWRDIPEYSEGNGSDSDDFLDWEITGSQDTIKKQ